ncbi:unnamed protein product, partial [Rotaria magnacalcarata]
RVLEGGIGVGAVRKVFVDWFSFNFARDSNDGRPRFIIGGGGGLDLSKTL